MMETPHRGPGSRVYASGRLGDALNPVITRDTAHVFRLSHGEGSVLEPSTGTHPQPTWNPRATHDDFGGSGDSGACGGAQNRGSLAGGGLGAAISPAAVQAYRTDLEGPPTAVPGGPKHDGGRRLLDVRGPARLAIRRRPVRDGRGVAVIVMGGKPTPVGGPSTAAPLFASYMTSRQAPSEGTSSMGTPPSKTSTGWIQPWPCRWPSGTIRRRCGHGVL